MIDESPVEAAEDQAWLAQSDQAAGDRYTSSKLSKGLVAEPVERRYGDQITYLSTAAPDQPERSRSKELLERARARAEAARQGQNPVEENQEPPAEDVPAIADVTSADVTSRAAPGPSPEPLAVVSEPVVPEPALSDTAVPEFAALEPAVSAPAAPEPAAPEPIAPEPIDSEPIASEAIVPETAFAEPTVSAPPATEADLLASEDVRHFEELPVANPVAAAPTEPPVRTATEAELLAPANVRQIEELPVESATAAAPAEPMVTIAAIEPPAPSPEQPTLPRFRVQLAALASEPAATQEWQRLQGAYPDILGSLNLVLDEVVLDGNRGIYLRVQASDFASAEDARAACALLKSRGQNCFVVLP